jgi:hypothetical protein
LPEELSDYLARTWITHVETFERCRTEGDVTMAASWARRHAKVAAAVLAMPTSGRPSGGDAAHPVATGTDEPVTLDDLVGPECGKTGRTSNVGCDGTCSDCTDDEPPYRVSPCSPWRGMTEHPQTTATAHDVVVRTHPHGTAQGHCLTAFCGSYSRVGTEAEANDWADAHRADSIRPAGPVVPLNLTPRPAEESR